MCTKLCDAFAVDAHGNTISRVARDDDVGDQHDQGAFTASDDLDERFEVRQGATFNLLPEAREHFLGDKVHLLDHLLA